jgi:hypothetical protein
VIPAFVARTGSLGSSVQQGAQQVACELGRQAGTGRADVDHTIARAAAGLEGRASGSRSR